MVCHTDIYWSIQRFWCLKIIVLQTSIYSLMCNKCKQDKCIIIVVVGSKSNSMIFFFTLISGTSIILLNSSYDTTSLTNDSVIMRYMRTRRIRGCTFVIFFSNGIRYSDILSRWKTFEPLPEYHDILFRTKFHSFQVALVRDCCLRGLYHEIIRYCLGILMCTAF